jgi:hypothetical protein
MSAHDHGQDNLRLSRASMDRMEGEEPEMAAALHRRLAEALAERVSDTLRAFDALLDQPASLGSSGGQLLKSQRQRSWWP